MPFVNEIHVVVDVGDDPYVGTNSALTLTVSGGGADLWEGSWTAANFLGFGQTVPQNRTGAALVPRDTDARRRSAAGSSDVFTRSDLYTESSYLIYTNEDPYADGFETERLDPSSIRLAIRGSDRLDPGHIVVWGLADLRLANYPEAPATVRTPVPLGMALNVNRRLSSTFSEGPESMLIPRVQPWWLANPGARQRRVDQIVLTLALSSANNEADTPVTFRIRAADGAIVCSEVLDGIASLGANEWKTWLFPVTTPFSWSDIMPEPPPPQPCRLSIDTGGVLRLAHIFAFGIDSSTRPPALLPLVHITNAGEQVIGADPAVAETLLVTANHDTSETSPVGGNSLGGVAESDPDATLNAPGGLVVFARRADNAIWHTWQDSIDGEWSGWVTLGGNVASGPACALDREGRLNVFARRADNSIYVRSQTTTNGDWSPDWVSIGNGTLVSDPTAIMNVTGGITVFARGTANAIWFTEQTSAGSTWSAWTSLEGDWIGSPGAASLFGGRLAVFARRNTGAISMKRQTTPNAGWTPTWTSIGGSVTSDPAATVNARGALAVFARWTDNAVWTTWQDVTDGPFTPWRSIGGVWQGGPGVTLSRDRRLHVFARGNDNAIWQL